MRKHLRTSVRALVEQTLRSGDLTLDSWSSARPLDGLRAHQQIQRTRPQGSIKEVAISHQVERRGFILEVGGRIDGLFLYPDRVIVDEIKTTGQDLDHFLETEGRLHWGQAKVYSFLYALEHNLETIETQLTYYQLDTGETREIRKHFTKDELQETFLDVVSRFVEWAARIDGWHDLRDDSIRSTAFPFDRYRRGQREMAVGIYRTVEAPNRTP